MSEEKKKITVSRGSYIRVLAVAAVVLIAVAGCDFFGVSIQDRIDQFMSDVNAAQFSSLKEHLHSDAEQYAAADAKFWENYFPATETYTLYGLTFGASSATGVMESNDAFWGGRSVTFTMRAETAGVWKILSIARDSDTIFD